MVLLQIKKKRSSLSLEKYKKLSARYYRPYKIIKRVNDEAYELLLPTHVKVHKIYFTLVYSRNMYLMQIIFCMMSYL